MPKDEFEANLIHNITVANGGEDEAAALKKINRAIARALIIRVAVPIAATAVVVFVMNRLENKSDDPAIAE
jgi:hypothetical protein